MTGGATYGSIPLRLMVNTKGTMMRRAIYTVDVYYGQRPGDTSARGGVGSSSTYSWWQAQTWRANAIGRGDNATVRKSYGK